jgi:hypothetical protein
VCAGAAHFSPLFGINVLKTPLNTMNQLSFSTIAPFAMKGGNTSKVLMMMAAAGHAPVLPPQKGPSRPKEGGSPGVVYEGNFVPTYSGFGSFEPQNSPYFSL